MGFGPTYVAHIPRHLKGGTAEIRFVMGPGRVCGVYNCKSKKKKNLEYIYSSAARAFFVKKARSGVCCLFSREGRWDDPMMGSGMGCGGSGRGFL